MGCRQGIVQRVSPHTSNRVNRDATVSRTRRSIVDAPGLGRPRIDITGRQGSSGARSSSNHDTIGQITRFGDAAARGGRIIGHHRRVIRTDNRHVDLSGDHVAVLVVQRNGKTFDPGLALSQIFHRAVRHRVDPAQRAVDAGARRVVGQCRRQLAQVGSYRGANGADQMRVSQV